MKSAVDGVKPVFVFSGAGPQWWGMGRELLEHEGAFACAAERCDAIFQRVAGWSILAEMSAPEDQSLVMSAHIAPSANFILQAALVALWRDHGIEPAAAVGHSSGEVTAAYVAGVLALDDAIRISYRLGALQRRCVGNGTMLAVGLNVRQARCLLAASGSRASVAAVNAPSSVTLAGEAEDLKRVAAKLESENIFCRFLRVDVAYHSPHMEPVQNALRSHLQDLRIGKPSIPLYSTVTGRLAERQRWDADYWCSNLRQTVLFEKAVDRMIGAGHRLFLELGAHPVLSPAIRECLAGRGAEGTVLASMRRGEPERVTFLAARDTLLAMEDVPVRAGSAPAQRAGHGVTARLASGL